MRTLKNSAMLGVTLLEILLVLAISASVILLSVRYYGSATSSLQANNTLQTIQAITATADSYASNGSYESISNTFLNALLPRGGLVTAWGTSIKIKSLSPSSYEVTLPSMPSTICTAIATKLSTNNHYNINTPCSGKASDFVYDYVANA